VTSVKLLYTVCTVTGFHTSWLMACELTRLKFCWLFFLEYHARESVPYTQQILSSWNIG